MEQLADGLRSTPWQADHSTFWSWPTQAVIRIGLGANLCAVVEAEARDGIQSYVSESSRMYFHCKLTSNGLGVTV